MKPRSLVHLLIGLILIPVTIFYLWGAFILCLTAIKSTNPDYPFMLLPIGYGIVTLWTFTFKYEKYAKENRISLSILMGLICGSGFSIYLIIGVENIVLLYLYGSPIILLSLLASEFIKLKNIKNA